MKKYTEMNHEELLALKKELDKEFEEIKAQGLALDMSRGKPSVDQLNISMDMMDVLSSSTAGTFYGNDGRSEGRFRSEMRDWSRLP